MTARLRLLLKILFYWLLTVFCLSVLYVFAGYPSCWDDITHGMTRAQVHGIVGEPTHSSWPEKGDFYEQPHGWGGWELFVGPDTKENTAHTRIWLWMGKGTRYYIKDDGSYLKAIHQQVSGAF